MTDIKETQSVFIRLYEQIQQDVESVKEALRRTGERMQEKEDREDLVEISEGVSEPMDITMAWDDEHMASYLAAKRCIETEEVGRVMCHDECIGWLAEHYLDVAKGKDTVYDTDEDE